MESNTNTNLMEKLMLEAMILKLKTYGHLTRFQVPDDIYCISSVKCDLEAAEIALRSLFDYWSTLGNPITFTIWGFEDNGRIWDKDKWSWHPIVKIRANNEAIESFTLNTLYDDGYSLQNQPI